MPPCSAARARFAVIAGVAVYMEDHVGGAVCDPGIRVCGAIVQQLDDLLFCLQSGLVLFGGQGAEGHVQCAVNSSGIIQQSANNLRRLVGIGGQQRCSVVQLCGRFLCGAILDGDVGMWQVLWWFSSQRSLSTYPGMDRVTVRAP